MSNTMRNLGLAALIAVSASAFMSGQASALSMADCSAKFKAAKAAGTDAGAKWNDFRKAQCGTDAPAATMAKATAPAATTVAATTTAAATTPSGSFMQNCSATWKGMKKAKSVPAGMTFKDFLAAKCVAPVAGAAPAAPATPMAKTTAAAPAAPMVKPGTAVVEPPADGTVPTVDKNGKPLSVKQIAMRTRERACGAEWRGLKAAGKTPVGMGWPQYWSACNKRMKAAGQ